MSWTVKRTDIINRLIKRYDYNSYLEIGVRNPDDNFNLIELKDKDGVDPKADCNFRITSDEFFEKNKKMYDIIFIDGLHLDFQVMRDVTNSLRFLNKKGTIVMHDCNPIKKEHQVEEYHYGALWNGTTWKAYANFRVNRDDLFMNVVDTDHGVGVVRFGKQRVFDLKGRNIDFNLLNQNRKALLNLISVEEFEEKFKI